jgi:two-component system LytT family response regulator
VFATAYDQYALRAFAASAVDYLIKPVEPDALARAVFRLRERQANVDARLASRPPPKRLVGKRLQRIPVLPVENIAYCVAEDELVFAATVEGLFLLNATLGDLEARLDPEHFVRVYKSAIVNPAKVAEIDPNTRSSGSVRLVTGETLELSRRYAARLRELLG